MITLFKRATIIGGILLSWGILLLMIIQEELGLEVFSKNNSSKLYVLFTNFLWEMKININFQIAVLILAIILIEEIVFRILAIRNSYN